jgi:hypothetical protein
MARVKEQMQEIYDAMDPQQQEACNYLVGRAISDDPLEDTPLRVRLVYVTMTPFQRATTQYLVAAAIVQKEAPTIERYIFNKRE